MKLADDEVIKAEYYFNNIKNKDYQDESNKSILTNKRLIVTYQNSVENYPLSKITGVKIKTYKRSGLLTIGIILCVLFVPLPIMGLGVSERLVFFIPGLVCLIFGLRKRTGLIINQMGGEKKYLVKKVDNNLNDFITSINHSLS